MTRPLLAFEESAVVVTGLTPGGEVQLFSVAREAAGYLGRVVRRDERLPIDATGTARYELSGEVPLHSVWAAIDLASGGLEIGSPPGFEAQEIAFPSDGVQRGSGGRWNRLRSRMGGAYVVYLRPGSAPDAGVWGVSAYDGAGVDADGAQDGRIDTALDLLYPLADSPPPPSELAAGDVLVVVDPRSLAFFATRFTH